MFPPLSYLSWARQQYGDLPYDLATSGVPPAQIADLGPILDLADPFAHAAFQCALAARYRVPTAEIVPCLGTTGALFVVYAALFSRGDVILVEEPTYEPLVRTAEALGLQVRRFPRTLAEGYRIEPEAVARALSPDVRGVVVSHLHNPSGIAASDDALRQNAGLLSSRGGHLIVDEVYGELAAPRGTTRSLAPNVVAVSSLTKCFGLGFLRAGWIFLPAAHARAAEEVLIHAAGHLPSPSLSLAAAGVVAADALAARRGALMAGKRARIDAFVEEHPQLSWCPPHPRSLFGFVHHRRPEGLRARLEQGRRDHGVLAVPGEFFGDPKGFRLGFTLPLDRLDEALSRLSRVVR